MYDMYNRFQDDSQQVNLCWGFVSNCCNAVSTTMKGPVPKIIGGCVAGTIALGIFFSTAFTTCSTIRLYNDSNDILTFSYIEPLNTDVEDFLLFPYLSTEIKFNGYNSYFDLHTIEDGTIHCNNNNECSLKNGNSNRDLEKRYPSILFYTCYQQYVATSSNSNSLTTNNTFAGNTTSYSQWQEALPELLDNNKTNTAYLRGSYLIEGIKNNNVVEQKEKQTGIMGYFGSFFNSSATAQKLNSPELDMPSKNLGI